ncbi:hypothetical protein Purlil1_13325 [Purpureocillium lilacinum]|uniref:Uncharacterized protein n=1 Tax=Purpureocillium lilacinum TaxID=33203 RepID=A0ABR0BEE5_PURLI|nr:hypothetical protein Purlil1_13325 [Purpureocillium lilacinum]
MLPPVTAPTPASSRVASLATPRGQRHFRRDADVRQPRGHILSCSVVDLLPLFATRRLLQVCRITLFPRDGEEGRIACDLVPHRRGIGIGFHRTPAAFTVGLVGLLGPPIQPTIETSSLQRQSKWGLVDTFYDSAFQPPPPEVNGAVYETTQGKAHALRRATLEGERRKMTHPTSGAEDATIRTRNTSPGSDNIAVKMLRAAWHVIDEHVRRRYEDCLRLGRHPLHFREAEVIMITKPGRRSLLTPRAWRPISLLSYLGKGLEGLTARRLVWAAMHDGVLHPQ